MLLAHFEMPLTLERRQIDAGDTGDSNIIERQVSYDPDLGRPIVTLDRAQVGAAPVDRHAKFSASSRVGEFDADMTARDGFLQGRVRFFAQARFHRMVALAEKLHELAHSAPPRRSVVFAGTVWNRLRRLVSSRPGPGACRFVGEGQQISRANKN